MTVAEKLEAVFPRTESSEVRVRINALLAREVAAELPAGDVKDELVAVTPVAKSSEVALTCSSTLIKRVLAELPA